MAVAVNTDISFKQVKKLKDMLANPDAFKAAAPAPAAAAAAAAAAPKPEEKEKEEEEETPMMDLFG